MALKLEDLVVDHIEKIAFSDKDDNILWSFEIPDPEDASINELLKNAKIASDTIVEQEIRHPQEWFYTASPITKTVSEKEFYDFIRNYPRKLERDVCGISDPPAVSYNDFELADRWPYSIVASTFLYDDNPGEYFYEPPEKRCYSIVTNYEELFNSKTGNSVDRRK